MRSSRGSKAAEARDSFRIVATRIKADLSDDKTFYWFYISLHLEQVEGASMSLSDIDIVEYQLLHSSFPNPNVRITTRTNGFEYKLWCYGFFRASADVVTKDGEVLPLPATNLSWEVEKEEMEANGKDELSWG